MILIGGKDSAIRRDITIGISQLYGVLLLVQVRIKKRNRAE